MPPKRKRVDPDGDAPSQSTRKSTRTNSVKQRTVNRAASKPATSKTTVPNDNNTPTPQAMSDQKDTGSSSRTLRTAASSSKSKKTPAGTKNKSSTSHDFPGVDDEPVRRAKKHPQQDDEHIASTKDGILSVTPSDQYSLDCCLALFSKYTDPGDAEVIGPEGFEKLCTDAGISLEGALPLIFMWQLNASEMGKITREQWRKGMGALQISSLKPLLVALQDLDELLLQNHDSAACSTPLQKKKTGAGSSASRDGYDKFRYSTYSADRPRAFSELYQFCFTLAKPPQGRNIDMETAMAFWSVLLAPKYPIITEVIEFLSEKRTYKGANKDLWIMMLEFCRTHPSLENYETDGAWPTLIDDFVLWRKSKSNAAESAKPAQDVDE